MPRDVQAGPPSTPNNQSSVYGAPLKVGTIQNPAVSESSGLVASRTKPGFYWTHNDSGDGPFIYALDQKGKSQGVWRVTGAEARDWEDIAAGPGPEANRSYLYIGDIGDNDSARSEITVYRVLEPNFVATDSALTKSKPRLTETADVIRLRYPDGRHDAEALMIHPTNGSLYVVTKIPLENPSVYEAAAPLNTMRVTTLKRLGELAVPSLAGGVITGGDISSDGTRVALCDYFQGYELLLPQVSKSFDDIWKEKMSTIDLGNRNQGESIAYRLDGKALLTTSEGRASLLIEVVRKK